MPQQKSLFYIPTSAGDLAARYDGAALPPVDAAKADFPLVILAHGFGANTTMGESGRLFRHLADDFATAGIGALAFDFMGHGQSDGRFEDMTPNTRLRDLHAVIDWVKLRHNGPLVLLGMSFGGAVAIYAAAERPQDITALVTLSAVPSLEPENPSATWFVKPSEEIFAPGSGFIDARPAQSVGDAYKTITLPKLQIQGSNDYPHFIEEFSRFYTAAPAPKEHIILEGGDHAFTTHGVRNELRRHLLAWIKQTLKFG